MEIAQLKKTLYLVKNIVKYGIFIASAFGTLHCLLLYLGYDVVWLHLGMCGFAFFLGIYLSKLFGLCWVHKLNVCYIIAILICIVMRRHEVFDLLNIDIHLSRGIMFLTGLILQCLTLWKLKTQNCSQS